MYLKLQAINLKQNLVHFWHILTHLVCWDANYRFSIHNDWNQLNWKKQINLTQLLFLHTPHQKDKFNMHNNHRSFWKSLERSLTSSKIQYGKEYFTFFVFEPDAQIGQNIIPQGITESQNFTGLQGSGWISDGLPEGCDHIQIRHHHLFKL